MINSDGNIIIGTSVDVGGMNTGLKKISTGFKKLGRLSAGIIGISAFVNLGKSALNAASDLQEVQNIVDVTFKSMSYKIEQFSETCIEKFGMSRLAAKQTAGSFMAMGTSLDLSLSEASDMAIKLTGLTADFSSFYNISQDYARVALSAVYTGETETLKRYGIVMTEANLQQFALTEGITKSVKAMSAREKAMLRYQYILKTTSYIEGDFQRTENTWANQVRVLKQRWQEFLIVLGNGLITVLTPVLKMLNTLLSALINFSNKLGAIMTKLFGIHFQSITDQTSSLSDSSSDLSDSASSAADSEDDLADSTNAAAKAAKKALAVYDELNVIQKNTSDAASSGGSGAGGINGGDSSIGDGGLINKVKESLESNISDLYGLGEYVGSTIASALEGIDWKKVYKAASTFGTGLAQFLNGLISPRLFSAVAATIAGALNTAIQTALSFGMTFDWKNLGTSIGTGINTFFSTFDFKGLAQTINTWVQGLFTALITAIKTVDWSKVYDGIVTFLSTLDIKTIAIIVGAIFIKKILGLHIAAQALALIGGYISKQIIASIGAHFAIEFAKETTLTQAILTGLGRIFMKLPGQLGGAIQTFAVSLCKSMSNFFLVSIPTWVKGLEGGFETLLMNLDVGNTLNASLTYAFGPVVTAIAAIVAIVGGGILAIKNFFDQWNEGFDKMKALLTVLGTTLVGIGLVIAGLVAWPAIIVAAVVGVVAEIVILLKDNWDAVVGFFKTGWETISSGFTTLVTNITAAWSTISTWFNDNVITPILGFFKGLWEGIVAIWTTVSTWFNDNVIQPVVGFFEGFALRVGQIFTGLWIIIKAVWILASGWFKDTFVDPTIEFFKALWTSVSGFFTSLWSDITGVWTSASTWFDTNVVAPTKAFFKTVWVVVGGYFTSLWDSITTAWSGASTWFNTNVVVPVKAFFKTVKVVVGGYFTGLWEGIKSVWKSVSTWFNANVVTPFKTIWKNATTAIGGFFTSLWEGIIKTCVDALNGIIGAIEGAINWMIGGVNNILGLFNTVVGAAAKVTGDKWGGVTLIEDVKLGRIKYPKLASGAVLPPNSPFAAIVGDQKHGTNIEAPLDTIKQALKEVVDENGGGGSDGDVVIQIDGKEVFRAVRKQDKQYSKQTGKSAFAY